MGSWSVYCGISNITIISGTKVVLVPIVERESGEYNKWGHYCLPIFGEYNDYGGIDNIEEDFNTKLIENIHNCKIDEFCECLTRMDIESTNETIEETLKDIKYLWINREVYDYMISYHPIGYSRAGDFDIGSNSILNFLGFKKDSNEDKSSRYFQIWNHECGLQLNSDGNGISIPVYNTKSFVEYIKKHSGQLKNKEVLLDKIMEIDHLEDQNLYTIFNRMERYDKIYYRLLNSRNISSTIERIEWINSSRTTEKVTIDDMFKSFRPIEREYLKLVMDDVFCGRASDLITLSKNMYSGSYDLTPYTLYITPQCGEHTIHQKILEKFVDINKKYTLEE